MPTRLGPGLGALARRIAGALHHPAGSFPAQGASGAALISSTTRLGDK